MEKNRNLDDFSFAARNLSSELVNLWFQPEISFQTPTRWLNLPYILGNRIIKFKEAAFFRLFWTI